MPGSRVLERGKQPQHGTGCSMLMDPPFTQCARVLGAFKLNPYDVLGVDVAVTEDDIR